MKATFSALVVLLLALTLALSACAPQAGLAAEPTAAANPPAEEGEPPATSGETLHVVIATNAEFPPMEYIDENKELVGFDIDMVNAIAEEMGFTVEYKNTAWDGIFAGLESGDYDAVLSAVTIREDRQKTYDFTDPYINAGQAVVVRADETRIASAEDLPGMTAGAQIGTTGAFAIGDMEGATLKEYDTIDLALLDLVNGNLDAVVVDTPVAADYALASAQFKGKLKIVGGPFTDEYYGVCVRKGESQEFVSLFNEGLARIRENGTYDAIYAKWISGEGTSAPAE